MQNPIQCCHVDWKIIFSAFTCTTSFSELLKNLSKKRKARTFTTRIILAQYVLDLIYIQFMPQ